MIPTCLLLALAAPAATVPGGGPARPGVFPIEIRYGVIDPPVVAQSDVTVRAKTSIHPLDSEPRPLECSSLASVGGRLVLTSDRHSHVLFSVPMQVGANLEIGTPRPQPIVQLERDLLLDAECIAARRAKSGGGWTLYVVCSLSNDPAGERRAGRQHAARLHVDAAGDIRPEQTVIMSWQSVRDALHAHFEALGVTLYESFNSERGENTPRWGSVEGIAFTPTGALLCGMRTPLAGSDAMLFVLDGVDVAFEAEDPRRLRIVDLFRLDLGGRGVTDLAWDPQTNGYLISAALNNGPRLSEEQVYPLEDLASALFWWSGAKADAAIPVASVVDMNLDAVCRIGGTDLVALGTDEGDVSEERRGRQSVVTLLHFTGLPGGGH